MNPSFKSIQLRMQAFAVSAGIAPALLPAVAQAHRPRAPGGRAE